MLERSFILVPNIQDDGSVDVIFISVPFPHVEDSVCRFSTPVNYSEVGIL